MERSWSEAAAAALDGYPWPDPRERERARREAELVSFGGEVGVDDLPLRVRKWLRETASGPVPGWVWKGQSWAELTAGFERAVLSQALRAHGGNVAAAARALKTTPRVVAYKARKHGLAPARAQRDISKQANEKEGREHGHL